MTICKTTDSSYRTIKILSRFHKIVQYQNILKENDRKDEAANMVELGYEVFFTFKRDDGEEIL